MTEELDPIIKQKITDYTHLRLGACEVVTPYFINDKRRKDLRAMVGKGTPEEIVMEARIWEKLKGVHFEQMNQDQIKEFLTGRGLGIDCSGFIVHILDAYTKSKLNRHIWKFLKISDSGFNSKLRYMLRPVEQLGAGTITNADNCFEVDLNEVRVMDLIRSKSIKLNGHHIMLVSKVTRNENGNVEEIEYTHSTPHYSSLNGVKTGIIKITDINKPLEDQNWMEVDEGGICQTLEGYKRDVQDNGIRRLKFLN